MTLKRKVTDLEKKLKKTLDENIRGKAEKHKGQIYAHSSTGTILLIQQLFMEAGFPIDEAIKQAEHYNDLFEKKLEASEARTRSSLSKESLKAKERDLQYFSSGKGTGRSSGLEDTKGQKLYLVFSYSSVKRIKYNVGKAIERDTNKKISRGSFTGKVEKGTKAQDATGQHIEHGAFGAPLVLFKALKLKQALDMAGGYSPLVSRIETIIERENITSKLSVDNVLTHHGNFKKDFSFIISGGSAAQNLKESALERKISDELESEILKDLPGLRSSPSLLESIESVLLYKFAKSKIAKVTSTPRTKPKASHKSKSSASSSRKSVTKREIGVISGSLAPKTSNSSKRRKASTKSASSRPLAMIQEFNKRLPEKIAKNMQSPALNYRTGRFANSVRVVDAITTPQGFDSYGYTYMKGPYQTFEPGYAQGSVERDPRTLIDRSMREIAAELAIGRFYTRRV
jgi:hypothetical protein